MFEKEDYVSLETAKMLKEKGFDEVCDMSYLHHCRVKDEIYEKYPGLSDCGYRDLVDVDGLKEEEVYGYYDELVDFTCCNKPSWSEYDDHFIGAAPTLYEAQKWLFAKHNLHVCPTPYMFKDKDKYDWFETDIYLKHETDWSFFAATEEEYSSYQQALDAGIRKALELI